MQDEKEIKQSVKDLEAHLAFLADEATKKAAELSTAYKKVDATSSEIDKNNNILTELKKRSLDLESIIQNQNTAIAKNNEKTQSYEDDLKHVLADHEKQKRASLKELEKINQWVIDGNVDKDALLAVLTQLKSAIEEHKEVVDSLLEKQKTLQELEEKVSKTRAEVQKLEEDKHQLMQEQIDLIDEYELKVEDLESRATAAEAKDRAFTEEYDRKVIDLKVYETRVVEEYELTFPGRKAKLE